MQLCALFLVLSLFCLNEWNLKKDLCYFFTFHWDVYIFLKQCIFFYYYKSKYFNYKHMMQKCTYMNKWCLKKKRFSRGMPVILTLSFYQRGKLMHCWSTRCFHCPACTVSVAYFFDICPLKKNLSSICAAIKEITHNFQYYLFSCYIHLALLVCPVIFNLKFRRYSVYYYFWQFKSKFKVPDVGKSLNLHPTVWPFFLLLVFCFLFFHISCVVLLMQSYEWICLLYVCSLIHSRNKTFCFILKRYVAVLKCWFPWNIFRDEAWLIQRWTVKFLLLEQWRY